MGAPALMRCECGKNAAVRNKYKLRNGTVVRLHHCVCGKRFRSEEPPAPAPVVVHGRVLSPGMLRLFEEALQLSGIE
jgi:hypothetical protein